MSAQTTASPRPARFLTRVVDVLCFALLSGLSAGRGQDWTNAVVLVVLGLLLGGFALAFLGGVLALFNPAVRRTHGRPSVRWAVNRGFLLLIPFTFLALVAEFVLGWEATAAFASAGVMTASAAVGAELARLGGHKLAAMLLPMLGGTAIITVWLVALTFVSALLQGGG